MAVPGRTSRPLTAQEGERRARLALQKGIAAGNPTNWAKRRPQRPLSAERSG